MTRRDDVLRILAGYPEGLTDAEVARELKRLHPHATHQTANMICRKLADEGVIARDGADSPILNRLRQDAQVGVVTSSTPRATESAAATAAAPAQAWPWEGLVQAVVVAWLTDQGAQLVSQADTATKQRGTDVVAVIDRRRVHVEVKGWPSKEYSDPRRAGEVKPTQPTLQAAQWFAGALAKALQLRQSNPHDRVAIAVPDVARYRTLHSERADPLRRIGVELWFVTEDGGVEIKDASEPDLQVDSDSAAQRLHRAHQSWWRRDVLGLPAGPPSTQVRDRYPTLGNFLPESYDGLIAHEAGWNLMSDAARTYTRRRLEVLARTAGLAESDRLWRNMLSSQPLAFSIAGELRAHPEAATRVLTELTGRQVVGLDHIGEPDDDCRLDGIEAEWSPPQKQHTDDRSGFDIAAVLRLADASRLLLSIEVKYVDSFSRAPLDPEHYRKHLAALGLDPGARSKLVKGGASQFFRSVMLTESVRNIGLRGESSVDSAISVVLARADDTAADSAVDLIAAHTNEAKVARWTHDSLLDAAGRQPELAEWARQVRRRYVIAQ